MGTTKALDFDAHERGKLRQLPFEKPAHFVTVFMTFEAPVLLGCDSFYWRRAFAPRAYMKTAAFQIRPSPTGCLCFSPSRCC
jgi:hypothetical protein